MTEIEPELLVDMSHISKEFPGVIALNDVEFSLKAGQIHALLGENGAGKSTLIKVLTGVEQKDEGTILVSGQSVNPSSPLEAQALGISTVYQEVNLCPNLSVAENIFIGREPKRFGKIDWKCINQKAEELLKRFSLSLDVTQNLDAYSVAIQQMVAIARAVDISAKVLILDEPTSSLTKVEVDKLFAIMRMLKSEGMGIIFVTHFLDQVYEVSDTITILRNGSYVGTYPIEDLPKVELIAKMIGKEYADLEKTHRTLQQDNNNATMLELKESSTDHISHVNLSVKKNEVLGLSGLLGSGRSEIVRMIFGVDHMINGSMEIKRRTASIKDTLDAIKNGFAFCPENRKTEGIVGDLSVRENIILALQTKQGMFKALSRDEAEKIADDYIERLGIKVSSRDQAVKNLSGGNQQKVILARWLATNPELLMLDEPTRGIDIGAKAEIQKNIIKLAEEGMSLIFISSEIDEILRCCNRIAVLRDKSIAAELEGESISESAIMKTIAGGV
ncbi:MAG: sugar ABC transporter ATP-binding protein [Treponema sp.]|nr:sugar ABC transporter ATP-binding protein [Treponema sp.]